MGILRSSWSLILLGIFVYVGTVMGIFVMKGTDMFIPKPKAPEIKEPGYVYWTFRTNEVYKMIDELREAKEVLHRRKEALDEREKIIEKEKLDLDRLRGEVENFRQELSEYLIEVQASELENLKTEVGVYSNMKAENVVAIFQEKTDDEVVKLMALMKPEAIAPILEQMMTVADAEGNPGSKRVARILAKLQRFKQLNKEF